MPGLIQELAINTTKPIDYVNKDNEKLRELLESAEYALSMEFTEEEQLEAYEADQNGGEEDEGSASDSD